MENEFRESETEQLLPAIVDSSIIEISEQAEKRFEAITKIKRVALKVTNEHDWVDQNGKPYLQASGAEKVARLFGISWRISEPSLENLDGGHYIYSYTGEFSIGGTTIDAIGSRSSKDPFFKKYRYEVKGEKEQKVELPPSEIDRGDVKKSAYTNLLANGITRLIGIRNLTYDDLKEYAGITREQITHVEYKEKGKPREQSSQSTIKDPGAPSSEAQVKAIQSLLTKLGITDDMAKCEKAQKALHLNELPTSISKLTKGHASTLINMLTQEVNNDSRKGNGGKAAEDKAVAGEEQQSLGIGA